MKNLQEISVKKSKYDEIIEYLKQDNGYWLENDKWDLTEEGFVGKKIYGCRYIDFSNFENEFLRNELKYYLIYNLKENFMSDKYIVKLSNTFKHFSNFLNNNYKENKTFKNVERNNFDFEFRNYLLNEGFKLLDNGLINAKEMNHISFAIDFIKDFYDDREETEKDIWYSKNIKGAKIPASGSNNGKNNRMNFSNIPIYYRYTVKRYLKSIVTIRSWSYCINSLSIISKFFDFFYNNDYREGFLENLSRNDVENYILYIANQRNDLSKDELHKNIAWIRKFLEYIQMAQYDKAPKKEIYYLIFQDDIPRQENKTLQRNRVKFVPEPILKQLDNNIMDLDRPKYIPIYILLRETGWRGTDILNLRYDNCLEQIWNNNENRYNYYLCGEITKTGIAQLKIPIRDKVAEMVQKAIDKAKELSTKENNPKKYLFNTYEGKLKGKPLNKGNLLTSIKRLIKQKEIKDVNGELYHFKLHSLRHTRAKEYVEQGMGISVIQQILGHQSLQMTVHYATVAENVLYEKWKDTEDLDLFKVNTETKELEQIELDSENGENLIRYEYVKKNLDAVRVPFGVCFKTSKMPCKQQMNHCLTCASFCTTVENIPEYEEEIDRVKKQIDISNRCGRELWAEKNKQYLGLLEDTLDKVKEQKLVHKLGKSREEIN